MDRTREVRCDELENNKIQFIIPIEMLLLVIRGIYPNKHFYSFLVVDTQIILS
jgi:hypothetical protein